MEEFSKKEEQFIIEKLQRVTRAEFSQHVLGDLKSRIFGEISFAPASHRWGFSTRLIFAPAIAAVAVMTLAVGAGIASQASMPGDALYSLKSRAEALRVAITPNEAKKAELHAQFSYERIRELKAISEGTADAAAVKDAIRRYESNLKEVKRAAKNVNDSAAIAAIVKNLEGNVEVLLEEAEKGLVASDDRAQGISQRFVDSAQVSVAVLSEVIERLDSPAQGE